MSTVNAATFGNQLIEKGLSWDSRLASMKSIAIRQWFTHPTTPKIVDHFLDDTLNTFQWDVNKTSGATNFACLAAGSAVQGGVITATTSAGSGEGVLIYTGRENWAGDKNCGMAIRRQLDVVTNIQEFIGFVDPLTSYSSTPNPVTDIDLPTLANGAVTCAAFVIDTGQTLATTGMVLASNSTYTSTTKSMAAAATPATAFTPTAAKYYTYIIQTMGDNVRFAIRDENDALIRDATISALYEGGTLVHPMYWIQALTAAAKIPQIDFFMVWGDQ